MNEKVSTPNNSETTTKTPSLSRLIQEAEYGLDTKRKRTQNKNTEEFEYLDELEENENVIEYSSFESLTPIEENDELVLFDEKSPKTAENDINPRKSWIYNYIKRISDERVICLICNNPDGLLFPIKGSKNGTLSNIQKHPCLKKLKMEKNLGKSVQTTLDKKKVYGTPLPFEKQKRITQFLKKWLVLHEKPFAILTNKSFGDFVWELNNSYRVPAPLTIKNLILDDMKKLQTYLKKDLLPQIPKLILSMDLFTSDTDYHFLSVNMHWFDDKNGKLKSKLLRMKDCTDSIHMTGEEIGKLIEGVLSDFGRTKDSIFVITADAGANGKKAIEHVLKSSFFHCIPHRLDLTVKDGFEIIAPLLEKWKKMITFIHQSQVAWSILKEKQKIENELKNLSNYIYKMVQDVETRWNSTLDMLDRIDLLVLCLNETFESMEKEEYIISKEEHKIIKEIIQVLKPFKTETIYFSTESTPVIGDVWPHLVDLKSILEELVLSNSTVISFRDTLLKSLKERFKFNSKLIRFSSILHPIWKHLFFATDDTERNECYSELLKDCTLSIPIEPSKSNESSQFNLNNSYSTTNPSLSAQSRLFRLGSVKKLDERTSMTSDQHLFHYKQLVKKELDSYLLIDSIDESLLKDFNVLQWWWDHRVLFPILSKTAFLYHSIPAGSVAPERRFSTIGRLTTNRWSLKPETIEALVTLKDYLDDSDFKNVFK